MDKLKEKKKLLILWGNPYIFKEIIKPIIPKLAENFVVSLILVDFFSPKELRSNLTGLRKSGLIENYWIVPSAAGALNLRHHLFIKSNIKVWRGLNFDICLTMSEMQLIERYLFECILSAGCIRVCFWPGIGYLLRDEITANKILGRTKALTGKDMGPRREASGMFFKVIEKIRSKNSLWEVIRLIISKLPGFAGKLWFTNVLMPSSYYINRILLPKILVGKVFRLKKNEELTQLGSGASDAYIFSDELDAEVTFKLLKKGKYFVARYPTQGKCRCEQSGLKKKEAFLIPLSGFGNMDRIPEDILNIFYRDIKILFSETPAKSVHLRPHPNTKGCSTEYLRDFLLSKGIDVVCVSAEKPINEIMCDYLGMAGQVTNSLRDGRASCDYALVIGFAALGWLFSPNPRFSFGNSEGIDWIETNGSYDRNIFKLQKYISVPRKSIEEILLGLTEKEDNDMHSEFALEMKR